ncbi:MAG TPA: hypothetical protein VGL54_01730 [Solirubrobacteraceae bacterium]|jgi:hypothetical protein
MVGFLANGVFGMVDLSLVPLVVFGTVAVSVVLSVAFLISGESAYDQIGQGGMTRDSEAPPEAPLATPPPSSAAGRAEQEREVRQMLSARSTRMVARGEPALDIDAEVAKLLAPAETAASGHDAELEAEVRQLVAAKNERRVRRGLEPLDVAAEVRRTLTELDP